MVNNNAPITPNPKKAKIDVKFIFRAIIALIMSFVIGLSIYTVNAKVVFGDDMPMPLGFGVGVVLSGSMEPELSVDDVIIVYRDDEYHVGDTVVFQSHSILVVHKIISIDGDTVITQGTANNVTDDPISLDSIKGKVIDHIDAEYSKPFLAVVEFVRSPIVALIILGSSALLLFFSYKSDKKEKDAKSTADLDLIRAEIAALKSAQAKPSPAGEGGPLAVDEVSQQNPEENSQEG